VRLYEVRSLCCTIALYTVQYKPREPEYRQVLEVQRQRSCPKLSAAAQGATKVRRALQRRTGARHRPTTRNCLLCLDFESFQTLGARPMRSPAIRASRPLRIVPRTQHTHTRTHTHGAGGRERPHAAVAFVCVCVTPSSPGVRYRDDRSIFHRTPRMESEARPHTHHDCSAHNLVGASESWAFVFVQP
jgi:hypothetical protein